MNIKQSVAGHETLELAIVQAIADVKAQPGNSDVRMQLFKLYCLQADWDRALRQLDIVAKTESESQRQCELYKNLILSERLRAMVMAGEREAGHFGEALPEWCGQLLKANALYQAGDVNDAEQCRHQALESADSLTGQSEGLGQFDWIADGDDRLGPVCEFISAGGYRWVPFSEIESLTVEQPNGLTDLVWAPATLVVKGRTHKGYLPARYPVSKTSEAGLLLGTLTEWQSCDGGRYIGQGRKMWITSNGECSLFEAGEIRV